jgi:hypothetical protein
MQLNHLKEWLLHIHPRRSVPQSVGDFRTAQESDAKKRELEIIAYHKEQSEKSRIYEEAKKKALREEKHAIDVDKAERKKCLHQDELTRQKTFEKNVIESYKESSDMMREVPHVHLRFLLCLCANASPSDETAEAENGKRNSTQQRFSRHRTFERSFKRPGGKRKETCKSGN